MSLPGCILWPAGGQEMLGLDDLPLLVGEGCKTPIHHVVPPVLGFQISLTSPYYHSDFLLIFIIISCIISRVYSCALELNREKQVCATCQAGSPTKMFLLKT